MDNHSRIASLAESALRSAILLSAFAWIDETSRARLSAALEIATQRCVSANFKSIHTKGLSKRRSECRRPSCDKCEPRLGPAQQHEQRCKFPRE